MKKLLNATIPPLQGPTSTHDGVSSVEKPKGGGEFLRSLFRRPSSASRRNLNGDSADSQNKDQPPPSTLRFRRRNRTITSSPKFTERTAFRRCTNPLPHTPTLPVPISTRRHTVPEPNYPPAYTFAPSSAPTTTTAGPPYELQPHFFPASAPYDSRRGLLLESPQSYSPLSSPRSQKSPSTIVDRRSSASSGPKSPPIILQLPPPTMIAMWIICQQITYFHDKFIDHITKYTPSPCCAKVLQKNLLYSMSADALVIAEEFAKFIHHNLNTKELGQRHHPDWSLDKCHSYKKLLLYSHGNLKVIFENRLGRRLETGVAFKPKYFPTSRHYSVAAFQGISAEKNDSLIKGMGYEIGDWEAAIKSFIEEFDPFHLPAAVTVMHVTASALRKAAMGVVRLVEHTYRIMLELRPIDGVCEAELVWRAMEKEHGPRLVRDIEAGLMRVAEETDKKLGPRGLSRKKNTEVKGKENWEILEDRHDTGDTADNLR